MPIEQIRRSESVVEKEKHPVIRLEFFRHEEPEERREGLKDNERRLTAKGRSSATVGGQPKNPDPKRGFVIASPTARAQETGLRQFLSNEAWLTEQSSLEDINQEINQRAGGRKKLVIQELLNLRMLDLPEYMKAFHAADAEGQLFTFLMDQSDDLVRTAKNLSVYSYTRLAGNVAQIVSRYIKIFDNWDRIAQDKAEKEMQRFLGSHTPVLESFLLKVMEKVGGRPAQEELIAVLANGCGYEKSLGYGEGFTLNIRRNEKQEVILEIKLGAHSYAVPATVIDDIITEREVFDNSIRAEIAEK